MHRPSLTGDYPRVGGEKKALLTIRQALKGSPLRRRGKDHQLITGLDIHRITPAWAGKS